MAKSKATGPLPTQILNPPETKERSPREPEQAEPPGDEEDEKVDPLDRRAPPIGPSRGSVQSYRPIALPTFNPIEASAAGQSQAPQEAPRFPGLFGRGLGVPPPAAQPQTAPPATTVNEPPPGSIGYISDEKMMRNLLSGFPDELLVNLKVWRLVDGQPAEEIGTLDFVPASIARDPSNFIDVQGLWIIDYRRSSDGKPLSKSKKVPTGGTEYYPGWKPHLIGGKMDSTQQMQTVAALLKALGLSPQTAVVTPGQQGTIGVPSTVHDADIRRLEKEVSELKSERTNLLNKVEERDREIRALEKKNTIQEMKIVALEARPAQKEGESDLVTIAKIFTATNKKDDNSDVWRSQLEQEREHSRQMIELATRNQKGGSREEIEKGWIQLFDGWKAVAGVNKSNDTADFLKALAPLGVEWMKGQQAMGMKQMEIKAAQQGVHLSPAAPPQAPSQPPQQPTEPPKPELTEEQQRIKMKSDLFEVTMGMIMDRVEKGAKARAVGDELATAVRTVLGQELAEGHPRHQMMIRALLQNPEEVLKELAENAGKDEAYAIAVSNRFKETFKRLAAEEQEEKPATVEPTPEPAPAKAPAPPDPHPVAAQDGAADTSGPSVPPAQGPESAAPSSEPDPSSGNGQRQGGEPGPVSEGSGGHDHRDGDGVGEAGEGVQGAGDPTVSN